MKTVRDILEKKGSVVWKVQRDDFIFDALKLMDEKNIGAVLVMDGDRLEGIFSERDYARKVVLKGKSSRKTTVGEAMTTRISFVKSDQAVEYCMALMTKKKIRHLPVLNGDALVGVISIGDVVQAKMSEQEFLIENLENYITGGVR